ncbi:MAG: hypothetical protein KGL39_53580 [Patescibacteria group bacterium]|nr:hypothetical protein [Patescibacteria group bacterium]
MPDDSDHQVPRDDSDQDDLLKIPGDVVHQDGGYDLDLAKRSVGAGWHGLLERLFAVKPLGLKIVQVKEKFGGLRVYTSLMPVRADVIGVGSFVLPDTRPVDVESLAKDQQERVLEFEALIQAAEIESFQICETCGAPGHLRPHPWLLTLCDACDLAMHAGEGGIEVEGLGGPHCRMRNQDESGETV